MPWREASQRHQTHHPQTPFVRKDEPHRDGRVAWRREGISQHSYGPNVQRTSWKQECICKTSAPPILLDRIWPRLGNCLPHIFWSSGVDFSTTSTNVLGSDPTALAQRTRSIASILRCPDSILAINDCWHARALAKSICVKPAAFRVSIIDSISAR